MSHLETTPIHQRWGLVCPPHSRLWGTPKPGVWVLPGAPLCRWRWFVGRPICLQIKMGPDAVTARLPAPPSQSSGCSSGCRGPAALQSWWRHTFPAVQALRCPLTRFLLKSNFKGNGCSNKRFATILKITILFGPLPTHLLVFNNDFIFQSVSTPMILMASQNILLRIGEHSCCFTNASQRGRMAEGLERWFPPCTARLPGWKRGSYRNTVLSSLLECLKGGPS
jgi:hypothetical protein